MATLIQGVTLATTTQSTLTLSGTDTIPGSLCYIGGGQVPVVNEEFSCEVPLAAGYQIINVEIWDRQKKVLFMSWKKPVYQAVGHRGSTTTPAASTGAAPKPSPAPASFR